MCRTLVISRSTLEAIRAHAATATDEVCGLLLGGAGEGEMVRCIAAVACANVDPAPATRFELDPAALFAARRAWRGGGPAIVGHYHSHPSGDTAPSAADAAMAPPDGAIWLIVAGGAAAAWRAVRDGAVRGRFEPVAIAEREACA